MSKGGKGFADKTSKTSKNKKTICPVCGESIEFIKHIETVNPTPNSMRFKEKMVGVCKCNRAEIIK